MPSDSSCDIAIIRPELRNTDIAYRGLNLTPAQRQKIKKALRTLHTLELMATTIYRFQITATHDELNRQLIAAMANEMTHYQDFQVKLAEYGYKPSPLRWAYGLVGFVFGFGSRLLGTRMRLKTGIWVETKAVHHYSELLSSADWDDATRRVIEKDQADEQGHIDHWRMFLGELGPQTH